MSTAIRHTAVGLGLTLLVACIGYGVFWLIAAHSLEQAFHDWAEHRRAAGDAVRYGDVTVDGFPLLLQMAVGDPTYASIRHDVAWQGASARLTVRPWNWRDIRVDFDGEQSMDAGPGVIGPPVRGRAPGAAFVGALYADGRLAQGTLEIADAELSFPGDLGAGVRFVRLGVARSQPAPASNEPTATLVSLHLEDVHLNEPLVPQLGTEISLLALEARLVGQPPERWDHAAVAAWREAGGTVEIDPMTLRWGPLDLRARGTVSVDSEMRPLGAMTADIRGYHTAISALEEGRVVQGDIATGLRVAVELLSRRDREGEGRVLSLPVTAQNGYVQLGPIKLLRIEPITFPARSG